MDLNKTEIRRLEFLSMTIALGIWAFIGLVVSKALPIPATSFFGVFAVGVSAFFSLTFFACIIAWALATTVRDYLLPGNPEPRLAREQVIRGTAGLTCCYFVALAAVPLFMLIMFSKGSN